MNYPIDIKYLLDYTLPFYPSLTDCQLQICNKIDILVKLGQFAYHSKSPKLFKL